MQRRYGEDAIERLSSHATGCHASADDLVDLADRNPAALERVLAGTWTYPGA